MPYVPFASWPRDKTELVGDGTFCWVKTNKHKPAKPIITPSSLLTFILSLNIVIPISATKMGVRELKIAASELSMFFTIAIANKNAGTRLPTIPAVMA